MNHRECVKASRYLAACALVEEAPNRDGHTATPDEVAAAENLLSRCIRYALADARQWERDNDRSRYNERQSERAAELLGNRRRKLNAELAAYGVEMCNFGLYPTLIVKGTAHQPIKALAQLFFF